MVRGLRVLLVEDDPEDAALVRLALERLLNASDRIIEAASIKRAEAALALGRPDLVLLDLTLPGESGFALLERLRADPATARVPVVVLSGLDSQHAIDRAYALGANSFVPKTGSRETLVEAVRQVWLYWGLFNAPPSRPDPTARRAPRRRAR